METMLFTERSIWTMVHGIVLGGGALLALGAALFGLRAMRGMPAGTLAAEEQARQLGRLLVVGAVLLWATVAVGTYVTFPPYRAPPPEGLGDLSAYPRALLRASPGTAWLHSFGMEIKEHVPWMTAMLATAVAAVATRYRGHLLEDRRINGMATALVAICLALVAFTALLGVFVNKVAPLE
ncbi:MAG TPA: hypothetical protein VG500_04105 [Gemmatimonadales bacterium]|jgi:hypothetical protein|nr:hypothetical protein [Gemmatimonadales bacterium]